MTGGRFDMPRVGPAEPVRFPAASRRAIDNGLGVWTIAVPNLPIVSAALVLAAGSASDPSDRPGLASLAGELVGEGAGGRDAIALSDALARLGSRLIVDTGADSMTISVAALARHFMPTLALLADVATRPHFAPEDFDRARELRTARLRQLKQSPGTAADRAFAAAVFGDHPYGHGTLGTTRAIEAATLDEVRGFWEGQFRPARATLVAAGRLDPEDVVRAASRLLGGDWSGGAPAAAPTAGTPPSARRRSIRLIDRPGAPQSELRVGHLGPPRSTPDYHALVTLNEALGGQFTSRLNRNLRESRGITYGARSAFDMRRAGGVFVCETSVQADATALAASEVLAECRAIQRRGAIDTEELGLARESLTRGYARHFETTAHLARALVELVVHDLPVDTFDRFVPGVEAVTSDDLARVSQASLRPDEATIVVVGDAARCQASLEALGESVELVEPEF